MSFMKVALGLAVVLCLSGITSAADNDSETEAFIKDVIKDARTDDERSSLLMDAVSLAEGNDKLKVALLEASVKYGVRGLSSPEACQKFQVVLSDLVKADPDRKAHWLSQKAAVYRSWSGLTKSSREKRKLAQASAETLALAGSHCASAGDWKEAAVFYNQARIASIANRLPDLAKMTSLLRTATYMYKVQARIDSSIADLKKSPDDIDARSDLVEKLVTVMDNPAEAMKYVNEDVDAKYRTFVPMAAKGIANLPVESCRTLGDWYYKELSKSIVPIVEARMLARAERCYQRALALHDEVDVTSAALKMNISRIKTARSNLGDIDPALCPYCTGTGRMACASCNGTGLRLCTYCKGSGRGKCTTCDGLWRMKCGRCGGRGKVSSGSRTGAGGMIYKNYRRCPTCDGKRVVHKRQYSSRSSYYTRAGECPTCGNLKPESLRGTSPCRYCSGKGGSGQCYTCRGGKTVPCTHCPAGAAEAAKAAKAAKAARPPYNRPPRKSRSRPPRISPGESYKQPSGESPETEE